MDKELRRIAELAVKWEERGGLKNPERIWLVTLKYIDNRGNLVASDHPEAVPLWSSYQR